VYAYSSCSLTEAEILHADHTVKEFELAWRTPRSYGENPIRPYLFSQCIPIRRTPDGRETDLKPGNRARSVDFKLKIGDLLASSAPITSRPPDLSDTVMGMKNFLDFVKTSLLGGLLVLLPIVLFYLMASELLGAVVALATPLADLLLPESLEASEAPLLVAIALILGVSFLFGIALRVTLLASLGRWIETSILKRFGIYRAVKALSRGMGGEHEGDSFKPAFVTSSDGRKRLVYLIEDLGNGEVSILVPHAPTGFSGPIEIVNREQIQRVDLTLSDVSAIFANWGVGLKDLRDNPHDDGSGTS
jgi:uncharacterized membrane protein